MKWGFLKLWFSLKRKIDSPSSYLPVLTLEGRLQRQGPTGLAISVIMEKALVGLCGPLTKLLGYVMKIPQKKKYFKHPVVMKVKAVPETDEYPTQLALGY